MNLLDELQEHVVCGDGAMGTLLLNWRERRPTRDQRHQERTQTV
jgi:methionine synthase I (cobalamin-dependent)